MMTCHFNSGFANDLALDGKTKSTSDRKDADNGSLTESASNIAEENHPDLFNTEHAFEDDQSTFNYNHSEDGSVRSPRGSPLARTTSESPSQIFSDPHFETSEGDAETHRYCSIFSDL